MDCTGTTGTISNLLHKSKWCISAVVVKNIPAISGLFPGKRYCWTLHFRMSALTGEIIKYGPNIGFRAFCLSLKWQFWGTKAKLKARHSSKFVGRALCKVEPPYINHHIALRENMWFVEVSRIAPHFWRRAFLRSKTSQGVGPWGIVAAPAMIFQMIHSANLRAPFQLLFLWATWCFLSSCLQWIGSR